MIKKNFKDVMVKVYNNTSTDIRIDHGSNVPITVAPGGLYDVPCSDEAGCADWTIYREHDQWSGKVPCKIGGMINIGLKELNFDETVLPPINYRPHFSHSLWTIGWILLLIMVCICILIYK